MASETPMTSANITNKVVRLEKPNKFDPFQRSDFSRIYGYAVASILFFHVAINVGMTIGIAPLWVLLHPGKSEYGHKNRNFDRIHKIKTHFFIFISIISVQFNYHSEIVGSGNDNLFSRRLPQ